MIMASALAIRHTREDDAARKNAESNQQVKRYRPGKKPEWTGEEEAALVDAVKLEDEVEEEEELIEAPAATRVAAPVIVKKVIPMPYT